MTFVHLCILGHRVQHVGSFYGLYSISRCYASGRHRHRNALNWSVILRNPQSQRLISLISTLSVCLSVLFKAPFMWLVCWAFGCDKLFIPLIIINDVIWRVTKCCVYQRQTSLKLRGIPLHHGSFKHNKHNNFIWKTTVESITTKYAFGSVCFNQSFRKWKKSFKICS